MLVVITGYNTISRIRTSEFGFLTEVWIINISLMCQICGTAPFSKKCSVEFNLSCEFIFLLITSLSITRNGMTNHL